MPGSPSSMLTAIRRGAGSLRTMRHLRPAGKPAPPRPRRPESSIVLITDLDVALAGDALAQQRVAAVGAVGGEVDEVLPGSCVSALAATMAGDFVDGGARHRVLADDRRRRLLAAADARRGDDAHVAPEQAGSRASRSCAPAISHDRPSQTRTVSAGGAAPPSLTTSKW